MAASIPNAVVTTPSDARAAPSEAGRLLPFVVALFFVWGFATVLIDTLIPKLKGLFALNYAEAMLTQFAFFIAYLVVSAPAGRLLSRIGYLKGIVVGLLIMAVGCLLFSPAAQAGLYWGFLVALFVMASGITVLQVAANPLVAVLGRPQTAHSRLNLAQAFNSLGTFIGPFVGAAVILKHGVTPPNPATTSASVIATYRQTEAHAVRAPFMVIAGVLIILAIVFWLLRRSRAMPGAETGTARLPGPVLLARRPRLALGLLSLFLYVGAEVSIGSLMVSYLMQSDTVGLSAAAAGRLVAFYWGGAMVGRLVGSAVMTRARPGLVLTFAALGAASLVALSVGSIGWLAAGSIVAVGLFNSIMFPTIFAIAIEDLGPDTPQGSGLLCMGIVGGAVIPLVTGALADHIGLSLALLTPVACYVWIAIYGYLTNGRGLARTASRSPDGPRG